MNKVRNDMHKARRMHPFWIISSIFASAKEFLVPSVMVFMIHMGSDSIIMNLVKFGLILYLIYVVISVWLHWRRFKYYFTDKELYIHEGRFIVEKRIIPLERIQNVQQNTSFFHRIFNLTSLTLNTGASGNESSVNLEMITRQEAVRIQDYLNSRAGNKKEQPGEEHSADDALRKVHYEMTWKQMMAASFTSLSLFAPALVLFALYSKIDDLFSIEGYISEMIHFFGKSWYLSAFGAAVLLAVMIFLSMGKNCIQYGLLRVTSDQQRIYIEKGVFNRTEFSISKKKVQAIKFSQTFLQRWFGFAKVELVSAGGVGKEEIEVASTIFPFIAKKEAWPLLSEILPLIEFKSEMTKLPRSSLFVKLLRPSYLWIIGTIAVLYFWPLLWYISPALLIFIVIYRILNYFNSYYVLNGPYIQLQTGAFSTELFLTTRRKIEELEVSDSWLQRAFGLASLKISTRAKPIHVSAISDIPKEMAIKYYKWYANR
ncbi:putative membrane protein [Scopulibacillus daqui]|uniref:Membrane protein n=1 Tax=Scopulibacillus daqui TaxID=1469162 RepID=A0ABS2PZH3_9BACL|nr:PH domain-containing protein [Scopulibacillus daqui]MBM7645440.1 putative membrane protein [Scopulibacillus daqui]